jgi:hypothetical protein
MNGTAFPTYALLLVLLGFISVIGPFRDKANIVTQRLWRVAFKLLIHEEAANIEAL